MRDAGRGLGAGKSSEGPCSSTGDTCSVVVLLSCADRRQSCPYIRGESWPVIPEAIVLVVIGLVLPSGLVHEDGAPGGRATLRSLSNLSNGIVTAPSAERDSPRDLCCGAVLSAKSTAWSLGIDDEWP